MYTKPFANRTVISGLSGKPECFSGTERPDMTDYCMYMYINHSHKHFFFLEFVITSKMQYNFFLQKIICATFHYKHHRSEFPLNLLQDEKHCQLSCTVTHHSIPNHAQSQGLSTIYLKYWAQNVGNHNLSIKRVIYNIMLFNMDIERFQGKCFCMSWYSKYDIDVF